MFRRKNNPDIFERLEKAATDELGLLNDLGSQHFDTEYLMELHAKVCEQITLQQRHQKMAISIGVTGAGWILLGTLAYLLSFQILTFVAFGLTAISFLIFFGLMIFSLRRFQTKGQLLHTRHSIEAELRSRRDKQRERMEDW
jgi:hypothetical protein